MSVVDHLLVLGHHHRGVVVVIFEAAVSSALQEQPHHVNLVPSTGAVERRVPTVALAVDVTAALPHTSSTDNVIQKRPEYETESQVSTQCLHVTSMRKRTMSALLLSTACMRGLWPLLTS